MITIECECPYCDAPATVEMQGPNAEGNYAEEGKQVCEKCEQEFFWEAYPLDATWEVSCSCIDPPTPEDVAAEKEDYDRNKQAEAALEGEEGK